MRTLIYICLLCVTACIDNIDSKYNITKDECISMCGPSLVYIYSDSNGSSTCECFQSVDGGAE